MPRRSTSVGADGPSPLDALEHLLRTLDAKAVGSSLDTYRDMVKRFARDARERGYTLENAEVEIGRRMEVAVGRMPEPKRQWITERLLYTCRTWYR